MGSGMLDSLPEDVLHNIWARLAEKDQHAMRACCPRLRAFGSPLCTVLTLHIPFFTFDSGYAEFDKLRAFTSSLPNLQTVRLRDSTGCMVSCTRRDDGGVTAQVDATHMPRFTHILCADDPVDIADRGEYIVFKALRGRVRAGVTLDDEESD